MQKGKWNGEQILPAEWVDLATSKHVSNGDNPDSDWAQGYGFQFWRCRHNVYRGDGMYSQFCVVMPDQNAVVAINSDCNNYQGILNVLFETLLPAMSGTDPLPENAEELAKLREVEKSLQPKEGESGSAVEERVVHSEALGRDVKYRVYFPNEYRTTSFPYPTLYLLHGLFGNETNWSDEKHGNMKAICDAYFAQNPSQKRIVVMPDGGDFWYVDSADDSLKYETFFFNELIPDVERHYRCKGDRESRAIAGLSMGGYGSAIYALRRPDMFESCYAMSPALLTEEGVKGMNEKAVDTFFGRRPDAKAFVENYKVNDPRQILAGVSDENKAKVRFMIDCGDDDGLVDVSYLFFQEARAKGVPCEFRVRDGGHTWPYWRDCLQGALEFIAK